MEGIVNEEQSSVGKVLEKLTTTTWHWKEIEDLVNSIVALRPRQTGLKLKHHRSAADG